MNEHNDAPDPTDADYFTPEIQDEIRVLDTLRVTPGVFTLGTISISEDVERVFVSDRTWALCAFIQRHVCGDYGSVSPQVWLENDEHVMSGTGEIMSEYVLTDGQMLVLATGSKREITAACIDLNRK